MPRLSSPSNFGLGGSANHAAGSRFPAKERSMPGVTGRSQQRKQNTEGLKALATDLLLSLSDAIWRLRTPPVATGETQAPSALSPGDLHEQIC